MRVFITGGTGLIGRALTAALRQRGDDIVILSRQAERARQDPALKGALIVQGNPAIAGGWEPALEGCDAVVNLAGHNIFAQRWNEEVRRKVRDSRVFGTENLVATMAGARNRPRVLVSTSAIGYYGPHEDEELTETAPPGSDFMAQVCRDWENAAHPAEALGARVALVRVGIVLDRREGALAALVPLFRRGLGSPVGSGGRPLPARGRQWMSWVHLADVVGVYLLALDRDDARGPINATAPNPVRNIDFSRALAKALRRWVIPFGPPDMVLKLLLGEVAQVVASGQKVLPARALELGHAFRYPNLSEALAAVFERKGSSSPEPTAIARTGG